MVSDRIRGILLGYKTASDTVPTGKAQLKGARSWLIIVVEMISCDIGVLVRLEMDVPCRSISAYAVKPEDYQSTVHIEP